MNIYHKINSIRKMLKTLEKQYEIDEKSYKNTYETKRYEEMPFKPGTMLVAESKLMQLAGNIRELRRDLNRLVYQEGKPEVIDWYEETNKEIELKKYE